ncbi:hypothetical protein ACFLYF_00170 [Chloroflexota bacterium]
MSLFGTSGIRRLVDKDLMQLSFHVGLAVGTLHDNVIVGRDTRTSSSTIRHSIISGILASGAQCHDAGVLPTPTLAFAASEFEVGIMITASHNPPEYNGIKLINRDGSAFSTEQQEEIEALIGKGAICSAPWNRIKDGETYNRAVEKHVNRILRDFHGDFKLKVVVDSGGGAAYQITPYMLSLLGCEVIPLNCYPSGIFPRSAEPEEANLTDLMETVIRSGADLGIAHDGNADRMMAVDNVGRFIPGDKMLAILAKAANTQRIVTTIDASMAIDEMGFEVRRTKVAYA